MNAEPAASDTTAPQSARGRRWALRLAVLVGAFLAVIWCSGAAGAAASEPPVPAATSAVDEPAPPVTELVRGVTDLVGGTVEATGAVPALQPVAQPVLQPVGELVGAVAAPLTPVVEPVVVPLQPVLDPLVAPLRPVLAPVAPVVLPVVDPVLAPVVPVLPDLAPTSPVAAVVPAAPLAPPVAPAPVPGAADATPWLASGSHADTADGGAVGTRSDEPGATASSTSSAASLDVAAGTDGPDPVAPSAPAPVGGPIGAPASIGGTDHLPSLLGHVLSSSRAARGPVELVHPSADRWASAPAARPPVAPD